MGKGEVTMTEHPVTKAKHLRGIRSSNVHVVRDSGDVDTVLVAAGQHSQASGARLAVIYGKEIHGESGLISALLRALGVASNNESQINWDDVAWLASTLMPPGALTLIIHDASVVIQKDPIAFAFMLDAFHRGTSFMVSQGFPVHAVIGPLAHRHEIFLGLLSIRSSLCDECLM
jgi:hypothetical protein